MADTTPHRSGYVLPWAAWAARGLALTAVLVCGVGCGGDEPPEPAPSSAASVPGPAPESQAQPAPAGESPARSERRRFDIPVSVIPAPAGTPADAPATLRGVARLLGKIPERHQIAVDHAVGCKDHEPPLSEWVIATETGELQNVVVYVVRGLAGTAVPEAPVELVQEGCVFKPHIVVVHSGQVLKIRNADQNNHNVNAKPSHGSNPSFNKMQPAGAADLEKVFPRAEIGIPIGCDIHPWMKAFIAVVDHDGWALSDAAGVWSIEVPPGDYLVEGWHERYGTLKGSVQVSAGEVAELDFSFEARKKPQ